MLDTARLLEDHTDAQSMREAIPFAEFVTDTVFVLKNGSVGTVLGVQGVDYETRTPDDLEAVAATFINAANAFAEEFRTYQYFRKHKGKPFSRTDIHFVVLHELSGTHKLITFFESLFETKVRRKLNAHVEFCVKTLEDAIQRFRTQTGDTLGVSQLSEAEAKRFFRRLLNPDETRADAVAVHDSHNLDKNLTSARLKKAPGCLLWGDHSLKVLTMMREPGIEDPDDPKGLPATFPNLLAPLQRIDAEFTLCLEWKRERDGKLRRRWTWKRTIRFGQRKPARGAIDKNSSTDPKALRNKDAEDDIDELTLAINQFRNGNYFGLLSLTVLIFDLDPVLLQARANEVMRVFDRYQAKLLEEYGLNRATAFFATLPGNHILNFRHLHLSVENYADLSFLWRADEGNPDNCLTTFTTQDGTPYYFSPWVQDVGHTLLLGAIGSGKTTALKQICRDFEYRFTGFLWVLDLKNSFADVIAELQGQHSHISALQANPFEAGGGTARIRFLRYFVKALLVNEGYVTTPEEDQALHEEIDCLFHLDRRHWRLGQLANVLPRPLPAKLQRWLEGGSEATAFDNEHDSLSLGRLHSFSFAGLDRHPEIMGPWALYLFHRINQVVLNPQHRHLHKLLIMDETWRLLLIPALRSYVTEALKLWREYGGLVMMATQSISDLGDMLDVVSDTCPTKAFGAHPGSQIAYYAEKFDLNEREQRIIKRELTRGQWLIHRPQPKDCRRVELVLENARVEVA